MILAPAGSRLSKTTSRTTNRTIRVRSSFVERLPEHQEPTQSRPDPARRDHRAFELDGFLLQVAQPALDGGGLGILEPIVNGLRARGAGGDGIDEACGLVAPLS